MRFVSLTTAIAAATLLAACGEGTSPEGPDPTVTAVTPSTGTVGTELHVSGANFRAGASVLLSDLPATTVELAGDTAVFARVPEGVEADSVYDVTVRNSDQTEATLDSAFTAVAPLLRFVNSATKPSGNTGSTVIVEGDAFGDIQGSGNVLFSDGAGGTIAATIAAAEDWTNTFIVTTVPSGAGTGPVLVTTATGTSESLPFTVTQNAAFSPSTINWTATQDLPTAVSGHHALYVPVDDASGQTVQYVFVTGGAADDSVPIPDVNVAVIQSDGSISGWNQQPSLADGHAFHRTVAATPFNSKVSGSGFIYLMGGIEAKDGDPVNTIFRAQLNNDGTIGAWAPAGTLPAALHSLGAALFRSAIYIAGGAGAGNEPVATVYRARIDTLGQIGDWDAMPNLPSARAYHAFQTFGGYLYAGGGETAATDPNDGNYQTSSSKLGEVVYARIDLRTGDVGTWMTNANAFKVRSKHSGLVAGGTLFVSSGLYSGAGSGASENQYAQINSDGTVGSFGGATGSNTLLSVGGANLFNQGAIAYVDAAGTAHVMILGGDDVNAPGSKLAGVLYY